MRFAALVAGCLVCGGCAADVRPQILTAANVATPTLVAAYEAQGDACVNTNATRAAAVSCLSGVETRWAPVWSALAAVSKAADALSAWCALSSALAPLGSASLPPIAGVVCP